MALSGVTGRKTRRMFDISWEKGPTQNASSELPYPLRSQKKKKKETYFVTVSYFTYEIDERFRHVDPKFG
jgi:hypothetical protein